MCCKTPEQKEFIQDAVARVRAEGIRARQQRENGRNGGRIGWQQGQPLQRLKPRSFEDASSAK